MYNALQTIQAFEAGQGQRKEREREAAMKQFGNALANNDYGGAAKLGFQISPELGMQAQQYGDSRNALATRRTIGKQLGAGDYKGGMSTAFAEGELDMGTQIQSMMQNMEQGDREKFAYSIQETAAVAGSLLSYATPEERKQALMSDPQLQKRLEMAGIPLDQALNAPMDNASLEGQMKMGFTAAQIMEMRRADAAAETDQERFDLGYGLDLRRVQLAEKEAADAAEARRLEAEALAAAGPEINVDDEASFRREYNSITSGFRDVQASYGRIKATDATTPAGQLSLVYQYMKMLDPGSTVMQGEQASAANAAGVPEKTRNLYNSIIEGKPLSGKQVADFTRQADLLYNRSLEDYDKARITYEGIANQYGFDPRRTVPDYATGRPTGEVFRGGAVNRIPQGAVQELMSDPSPEKMRFFDEYYGPGQAQKIIQQQGLAPSRITF
jgi:hypothetical protein